MERQPGQLPQPPERVEDGPVRQLVTVEVEQPEGEGGISTVHLSLALAFSVHLRFREEKITFFENPLNRKC